jgi:hypothetical protein
MEVQVYLKLLTGMESNYLTGLILHALAKLAAQASGYRSLQRLFMNMAEPSRYAKEILAA